MFINFLLSFFVFGYQLNNFPIQLNNKCIISSKRNINMLEKKINNIDIWYQDLGKKYNPAVILIMGSYSNCNLWPLSFIEQLLINNYRVIQFDNRDSGKSSWINKNNDNVSPYTLDDLANDTVELINYLNISKFHLIGLSMGGMISQSIAYKYSERILSLNLLLTSPILWNKNIELSPPSSNYFNSLKESIKLHQQNNISKGLSIIYDCLYVNKLSEIELQSLIQKILDGGYNPYSYHYIAMKNFNPFLNKPLILNFTTFIVQGLLDPIFNIDHGVFLNLMITNSSLLVLENCGHHFDNNITDKIINQLLYNLN